MTTSTTAAGGSGFAAWPHILRPATGPSTSPLVLALHGTGGTESDIVGLAERIAPGAAILAPRGRVDENGAGRWFRRAGEGVFDVDDVIFRAGELAEFVGWALTEYDLGGRPVIATGFSNGANMALALGMLHPAVAPTVVAFSGMYPFGDRTPVSDPITTTMLLLNGDDDPMAPSTSVDTLETSARASGATVTRVRRPGGHGITEAELAEASRWVADLG
ncbi:hypothetical protein B7R54_17850 [Subtercola boreus]|uniref:Phospholipase/carboxylesterase/thioesterase domain-containing protein n=1 Tax=Subtercola boreus TaxID=120213 RepID=A0A3E0VN71_9MICO|nr:alpha/beta hydrolase [Subtercola boreus]RFA10863.1 hypothetical protein B7R54_17850 [Subtercola boreus]TQL55554.1 phospholipase/carboxylesterase [Subtercola boreus]